MPSRPRAAVAPAALLAAALGVVGCSTEQRFPPACPALSMLPDAADLTRFSPAGQDITDMVADARITAVPATCSEDTPGEVDATLRIAMAVSRGPAATSRKVDLPYFVAVMQGDRVLDKQAYTLTAEFPANANQALPTSPPINLVFPVTREKSAAAYSIFVGYVLSPDELALNRKRGPR